MVEAGADREGLRRWPARRSALGGWSLMAGAQPAGSTLTAVSDERWRTLADALKAAASGYTIELQPGSDPRDVAVIIQPGLTLLGLGSGAILQADRATPKLRRRWWFPAATS